MEFKLNPFIKATYFLNAVAKQGDTGLRTRVKYPIEPNMVYDTQDFVEDTPNIEDLVLMTVSFVPYSKKAIDELKALNAPYSLKGCKSCGGKYTQIKIQVFEVI